MAFGSGCVEKSLYLQALGDASYAREQAVDAQARLKASLSEIDSLQADIKARDEKFDALTTSDANLQRQLEELNAINTTLTERLKRAGESVDHLAKDKTALTHDLSDTEKQLADLKKQQADAEARAHDFEAIVKQFQGLTEAGKLKVAMRNGRLILDLPNDVLFDSGKDEVKGGGKDTLKEVAAVLSTLPGKHFEVAGHTDNVKIATKKYPSNWELSTARAVRVTRVLQGFGVPPEQLSAAGYGEYDPIASNDDTTERAKNRRIEISIVPDLKALSTDPPKTAEAAPADPPKLANGE